MTDRNTSTPTDQHRDGRSRVTQIGFALVCGALVGVLATLLSTAGGMSISLAVLAGGGAAAGAVVLALDLMREGSREPVTAGFAVVGGALIGLVTALLSLAGGVPIVLAVLAGGGATGGGIALVLTVLRHARPA